MVTELADRLEIRRAEIERAILTRIRAIPTAADDDPEYALGLEVAAGAALSQALSVLHDIDVTRSLTSADILGQARRAAHLKVGLDAVVRRYLAGYAVLHDFILQELSALPAEELAPAKEALRAEASLLDRLIGAVAAEYRSERDRISKHPHRHVLRSVERLLAGEFADLDRLNYRLSGWHLGLVARGPGTAKTVRHLAKIARCRVLSVRPDDRECWAWLGFDSAPSETAVVRCARTLNHGDQATIALGEPGDGIDGWRLTHQQAKTTLPIAQRDPQRVGCHSESAMLAAVLRDDLLAESLTRSYLAPLKDDLGGDVYLKRTLRAYLKSGRNISSTAAALRVSRPTVKKQVDRAEQLLGHRLDLRPVQLEAALCLWEFNGEQ